MLADVSSVESLYNVTVDLVGLNSRQVRVLLENFVQPVSGDTAQLTTDSDGCCLTTSRIPEPWVEFVVSGVKLVSSLIFFQSIQQLEFDIVIGVPSNIP